MSMLNIALTEHHEAIVKKLLASGRYNNASEVVHEGLRMLEDIEGTGEKWRREKIEQRICVVPSHAFDDWPTLESVR